MNLWNQRLFAACVLISLGAASLAPLQARADDFYTITIKKQEEKRKTGWNLQDWLQTRDQMRLMDLWLALHSPSPYEFYLGGDWENLNLSTGSSYGGGGATFGAFASIFGLEGNYESFTGVSRYQALFKLRIFGYHEQSTHITLNAGMRQQDEAAGGFRNFVWGFDAAVYLSRFFGIDGGNEWQTDSTHNSSGAVVSGSRWELGAFIDFKFFRILGRYVHESEGRALAGVASSVTRSGPLLGVKIFF